MDRIYYVWYHVILGPVFLLAFQPLFWKCSPFGSKQFRSHFSGANFCDLGCAHCYSEGATINRYQTNSNVWNLKQIPSLSKAFHHHIKYSISIHCCFFQDVFCCGVLRVGYVLQLWWAIQCFLTIICFNDTTLWFSGQYIPCIMLGQIIATSHDLTPRCSWGRKFPYSISGKSSLVWYYNLAR